MTAKEFNRCLDALPNDRNALEKIYNEYYLQLVYTALSMTKNREAAYDIASTVMLKLAGYRRTEWINSPAGFLIRMVHNVTKDYFRKENRCMEALPERNCRRERSEQSAVLRRRDGFFHRRRKADCDRTPVGL